MISFLCRKITKLHAKALYQCVIINLINSYFLIIRIFRNFKNFNKKKYLMKIHKTVRHLINKMWNKYKHLAVLWKTTPDIYD